MTAARPTLAAKAANGTGRWIDDRFASSSFVRRSLDKVFPTHWSFMLGEIALYSFIILLLSGTYLAFFYTPSLSETVYDGSYTPLVGVPMSEAYDSTLKIAFDVRGGLLMRQVHHWAALLFMASIVVHLMRIFFTGAFRKPREINWVIGCLLLILGIVEGFVGYSLPDDLLSGTGLRIIYSVVISIPFVGPWLAFLLFGGEFPTETIVSRLFVFHILLLPAALIGLVGLHLAILWRQKHTQFAGPVATEENVVGKPFWPTQVFKSFGLMLLTAAVLALMGGLIQINPIWAYGPFDPTRISAPSQPDWYVGWLDGALRLFPPIEFTILGITIPSSFLGGVVIPGLAFALITLWPFMEAAVTGDRREHHLLDRPRDAPFRTAVGVAGLTFFAILTIAAGNDVAALILRIPLEATTNLLRVALVVLPIVAGAIAYRVCRELRRREIAAEAGIRPRAVVLRRNAAGGFDDAD